MQVGHRVVHTGFSCLLEPKAAMVKRKFYAVRIGVKPGVYEDWGQCKRQVNGYTGNEFKAFLTRSEAEQYVEGYVESVEEQSDVRGIASQPQRDSAAAYQTSKGCILPESLEEHPRLRRIEEQGEKFVLFSSLVDFDKHFGDLALQTKVAGNALGRNEQRLGSSILESANGNNAFPKENKASVNAMEPLTCNAKPLQPDAVYQLEFDGASKGNPGKSGAGALLRQPDGSVVVELKENLGIATNNVAEYCSLILGLREALDRGVTKIRVQGDSKLVCMQVCGIWKLKNKNLIPLFNTVKQLKGQFKEFSIVHIDRELNSAADALANAAVSLPETEFAHAYLPKEISHNQMTDEVESS